MALTEFGVNHPMAVRLWAKRVRFHRKPAPPGADVTR